MGFPAPTQDVRQSRSLFKSPVSGRRRRQEALWGLLDCRSNGMGEFQIRQKRNKNDICAVLCAQEHAHTHTIKNTHTPLKTH